MERPKEEDYKTLISGKYGYSKAQDEYTDYLESPQKKRKIEIDAIVKELRVIIYGIESNLLDIPEQSDDMKAAYKCEVNNHRLSIEELEKELEILAEIK